MPRSVKQKWHDHFANIYSLEKKKEGAASYSIFFVLIQTVQVAIVVIRAWVCLRLCPAS